MAAGKGGMNAGKGDMAAGTGGIHLPFADSKGGKGEVTGKGDVNGGKGEVTGKGGAGRVGMTRPRRVVVPGISPTHLQGVPEAHVWHALAEEDRSDTDFIQPTHIIQIPVNMAQGNTRTHMEVAETMRDSTRFNGPTHKNPYGNWVGGGVKIPKCTDKESSGTLWIPSRGILSFGNGHSWIFKIFRICVICGICHEKYNES